MSEKKKSSLSKKVEELEQTIGALQVAVNITQSVVKDVLSAVPRIDKDMAKLFSNLTNLDYRTVALIKMLEDRSIATSDQLNELADNLKLEDFYRLSEEDDKKNGYYIADDGRIEEDDVVIFTADSDVESDEGIFRSKIPMRDLPEEDRELFLNKNVGDTIERKIGDNTQKITILGIRKRAEVKA